MDRDLDTGPILDQTTVVLPDLHTANTAQIACEKACVELFRKNIIGILSSKHLPAGLAQNNDLATTQLKKQIAAVTTLSITDTISVSRFLRLARNLL